jgi:hypothetical protein
MKPALVLIFLLLSVSVCLAEVDGFPQKISLNAGTDMYVVVISTIKYEELYMCFCQVLIKRNEEAPIRISIHPGDVNEKIPGHRILCRQSANGCQFHVEKK